jgi:hypothetical protein
MKTTPIEKFQYLVHLKATNVHLFYRLLSENIKVRSGTETQQEQVADTYIGIDPSHLHPDRRRSLRTMARDLDTTRGHVPFMERPGQPPQDPR